MIRVKLPMPKNCIECRAWQSSFYHNCVLTGSRFDYADAVLGRQPDCPIIAPHEKTDEERLLADSGFEL